MVSQKFYNRIDENQIWEMLNLPKERTGLPITVYISGNSNSIPAVKFFNNYANENDILISVSIEKSPKILNNCGLNISQEDLTKIQKWIVQNYDLLMNLYNGEIDEIGAGMQQKPLEDQ